MSDRPADDDALKLHIDAHALLQLGEQLITDDAQALLELVKNSYDADAEWAIIRIDSRYVPVADDPAPSTAVGLIEVQDNGVGMDFGALRDSWLRISFSLKREQKARLKRSKRFHRLPIGDKGLGRLGTMRLGTHLSVETRTSAAKPGWIVTFQWSDIRSGRPLEEVPIRAQQAPANGTVGTVVRIFGLRNIADWQKQRRIKDLRTRLCGLISPFGAFRDFDVALEIDGRPLDLEAITESLRDTATVRFNYDWDGRRLHVDGRVKLTWFRKDPETFAQFISQDHGSALLTALKDTPKLAKQFRLTKSAASGWFIDVSADYTFADLQFEADHTEDPGPFSGSLDYFDLGGLTDLPSRMFDKRSDYQSLVKELAQMYIYRDGFGIGMNRDWLNLGGAWTGAKGYYSLKPNNVIGYFAISVANNPSMVEKSDREGFVDNPSWRGFKLVAEEVKKFANELLNTLGRTGVKYIKLRTGEHATEDAIEKRYSDLVARLERIVATSEALGKHLDRNFEKRRNAIRKLGGAARLLWVDIGEPKEKRNQAKQLLDTAEQIVPEFDNDYEQVRTLVSELETQKDLPAMIRSRIDEFEDRSELLYEMVAVGLSAQALAHDVPAVLNQIGDHAKALLKEVKGRVVDVEPIRTHAASIQGAAEGVGEMIDFVRPMLRGRRLIRQKATVSEFVDNYYALRGARLRTRGILWHLEREDCRDFRINYNPGRFIQVLDNLTTNSEYWIAQRFGRADEKGRISLTIHDPELRFWDNGPGIRPDLEETLFDLFTSGKPADEGNGLGLFITEQLLLRDNCTIALDSARNDAGRLFRFIINFSGVKAATK